MKSMLIVALLTILRLGIPAIVLLLIGETVKRQVEKARQPRGA